jgi:integrase
MASVYREKKTDSWRAIVRRKGHAVQTKTFPTKHAAQMWARRIEASIDTGTHVDPVKITLHALFERFKTEVCPHRPGGRWEQIRLAKLQRDKALSFHLIGEVRPKLLTSWRDKRLSEVSAASVNRELNLISGVITHARKEWHIPMPDHPVRLVTRPPRTKARNRRVAQVEIDALHKYFCAAKQWTAKWYVPWLFEFGVESGMRLGEMCRLRWQDVHADERWLYVLPSKNGDDRAVPLTNRALEILATVRRDGELVFPVDSGTVGVYFRGACKKLGIAGLHIHDSRHEACSRLAKVYSVMELAKIIGHRDLRSLMVYYNPTAMELAAKLGAAPPTPPHP